MNNQDLINAIAENNRINRELENIEIQKKQLSFTQDKFKKQISDLNKRIKENTFISKKVFQWIKEEIIKLPNAIFCNNQGDYKQFFDFKFDYDKIRFRAIDIEDNFEVKIKESYFDLDYYFFNKDKIFDFIDLDGQLNFNKIKDFIEKGLFCFDKYQYQYTFEKSINEIKYFEIKENLFQNIFKNPHILKEIFEKQNN